MALKYYLDTEFIEGFRKPISWLPTVGKFNKPCWMIELISIGMQCEDGRNYYAISNEFEPKHASDWVKDNVFTQLPPKAIFHHSYKSNNQIAMEIFDFLQGNDTGLRHYEFIGGMLEQAAKQDRLDIQAQAAAGEGVVIASEPREIDEWRKKHNAKEVKTYDEERSQVESYNYFAQPEIYAYYADYDWVVFCSLYRSMVTLPVGYPKYCRDLKQMFDAVVDEITDRFIRSEIKEGTYKGNRDEIFELNYVSLKQAGYPAKDHTLHDALEDARWNIKLHQFILKYKPR